MARETGVVTKWNESKGFGFVKADTGESREFYVHYTEIPRVDGRRDLTVGQRVLFTRGADDAGRPRASNVTYEAE